MDQKTCSDWTIIIISQHLSSLTSSGDWGATPLGPWLKKCQQKILLGYKILEYQALSSYIVYIVMTLGQNTYWLVLFYPLHPYMTKYYLCLFLPCRIPRPGFVSFDYSYIPYYLVNGFGWPLSGSPWKLKKRTQFVHISQILLPLCLCRSYFRLSLIRSSARYRRDNSK